MKNKTTPLSFAPLVARPLVFLLALTPGHLARAFELKQGSQFFQGAQSGGVREQSGQPGTRGATVGQSETSEETEEFEKDLTEEDDLLLDLSSPQQDEILPQIPSPLLAGGDPITVAFYESDTRDVIRAFAVKTRLSVVISPLVEGKITTQLYQTPSREALATILKTANLYYIQTGQVIRVVTAEEYRDHALSRLAVTRIYNLRHGSLKKAVGSIKPYITRNLGKVVINSRTSRIIVTDLPERHEKISEVLAALRYAPGQVLLTARIVEIQYEDQNNVGAFYQLVEQNDLSTSLSASFQSARAPVSEIAGGLRVNFRIDDIGGSDFPKSLLLGLNAVGIEGELNVLSAPRVVVQHNKVAYINIGSLVPYPSAVTTPAGAIQSKFDFVNAGTKLIIIPKIIDKDKVHMTISVETSSANLLKFNEDGSVQAPQKELTEAKMSATVGNDQTVLIGGFVRYDQVDDTVGIPLLKNIPGLKYLFSNTVNKLERREVAIFITPKLVGTRGTPVKQMFRQVMENSKNE